MALKYARTRHSMGGDFDRAKRQQQVIMAVFEQVTRLDLLPELAPRAPEIWQALQNSVATDITLEQAIALARLTSEVDSENIRYAVIDENYTQFWSTPDGQQVLIPLRDQIRELRDYIFTTQPPAPQAAGDGAGDEAEETKSRLETEAATVEVLNGTTTEGLAALTADHLRLDGVRVSRADNADRSDYAESLVIVYTGKTYTAEYVARLLGLPMTAVVHGADPNAEYDISLIVGADYQPEVTNDK